ncbi:MAG: hypothetical protein HQK74_07530 [Desulfamplus sp.]|nr:hypothetical protein [Desulfamplus sp.]
MKTREIIENMDIENSNFFRKIITPWYDSHPICWILILWAMFVFIFAITGIDVATTNESFNSYVWLPFILASLAFMLIIIVFFRMRRKEYKVCSIPAR